MIRKGSLEQLVRQMNECARLPGGWWIYLVGCWVLWVEQVRLIV